MILNENEYLRNRLLDIVEWTAAFEGRLGNFDGGRLVTVEVLFVRQSLTRFFSIDSPGL